MSRESDFLKRAARTLRTVSKTRMAKVPERLGKLVIDRGKRQLKSASLSTIGGREAREVSHVLKHSREALLDDLKETLGERTAAQVLAASRRGLKQEMIPVADELLGREVRDLVDTVRRYARGGMRGFLMQQLGPVGSAIDFILGKSEDASKTTDTSIEQAERILRAAGYQVTPPGHTPRQPPGRVGNTGARGSYPTIRVGSGGTQGSGGGHGGGGGGGGDPLPVGSFPGNQHVPMEVVHSSNVYAIGYDGRTLTMRVQYLGSNVNADKISGRGHKGKMRGKKGTVLSGKAGPGPVYDYHGVPARVFNKIRDAASTGTAIWDNLRVRGTMYGHHYDYELVAASRVLAISFLSGHAKRVARLTYVPRKAVGPNQFNQRMIRQGSNTFRSILPNHGMPNRGAPKTGRP